MFWYGKKILPRKDGKADVNAKNRERRNALLWAIKSEHWDIVDELVQRTEMDVNVQDVIGCTALMWACLQGRLISVSMLLKHDNIDTNLKNKAGSTALDIARKCHMHEIAQFLEEYTKVGVRRRGE